MKNLKLPRKTQVAIGVISLSLMFISCDITDEDNKQNVSQKNRNESIKVIDGTVEIESKTALKNILNTIKEVLKSRMILIKLYGEFNPRVLSH